jgi:hypothetical protein
MEPLEQLKVEHRCKHTYNISREEFLAAKRSTPDKPMVSLESISASVRSITPVDLTAK